MVSHGSPFLSRSYDRRSLQQANASHAGNSSSTDTEAVHHTPFGSLEVLDETVIHVLGFLIVLTAAHPIGRLFPRYLKLPLITGYLFMGVASGPFVANLISKASVKMMASSVSAMALSFISFQAGQELYLPELKPQLKSIVQLLGTIYLTAMTLVTTVLTLGGAPFFFGGFAAPCKLSIAMLFGSIAVLVSPATVMAIKNELQCVGPFTNLMLGSTMLAEFVVLISFSIARVAATVYCAKLEISLANLVFTMGVVLSNLLIGALIGLMIVGLFLIPGGASGHYVDAHGDVVMLQSEPTPHHQARKQTQHKGSLFGSLYFKGFVWIFMGYVFYQSTNVISSATIAAYGHSWDVKFEPLLVLMVGSCVAGHYASIRHDMHEILDTAAPFVLLPFFVMTGASLELDQVTKAIPLMSVIVTVRYTSLFVATYCAGRFVIKLPPHQYKSLWLTMTPQAGVSLGLANEVKNMTTDPWAAKFAATIVAAVVVNQVVGPALCAIGLKRSGESQAHTALAKAGTDDAPRDDNGGGGATGDFTSQRAFDEPAHDWRGGFGNDASVATAVIRRAVVIGDDDAACELALQLALHGAEVEMPLLDDERLMQWETVQRRARSAAGPGEATPVSHTHVVDMQRRAAGKPSDRHPHGHVASRCERAMAHGQNDLVVFTGASQRALEYVTILARLGNGGGRAARRLALLDDATHLDALHHRGVVCLQSSLTLANVAMRVALMDTSTTAVVAATEAGGVAERPWLTRRRAATALELQRVLAHRGRVLHRNVQASRWLQSMLQSDGGGSSRCRVPRRVSMFGRSSDVEFMGAGRGTAGRNGEHFFVPNEVFVMGGGQNGEGAFEDAPTDDDDELDVLSSGSDRAFAEVAATPPSTGRVVQFKPARGNHRR